MGEEKACELENSSLCDHARGSESSRVVAEEGDNAVAAVSFLCSSGCNHTHVVRLCTLVRSPEAQRDVDDGELRENKK